MVEFSGAQLCRTLREHPQVGAATPILMTSIAPVRRTDRVEALRAGAWDLIALPADTTELMLRLELFMRAKQEVVTARARSLLDISTDLYSRPGLLRRLRELSLDAYRRHTPVACLIVAPESEVQPRDAPTFDVATVTAQTMTRLMNDTTRASDTVGRLTHTEFAVIAPQTNSDGAIRLAERLYGSAQTLPPVYAESPLRVRIGCYAIESFEATVPPVEILARASTALQRAQYDLSAAPICVYD
jgi:diguanylate cyclase (GGDEF)-like protein